MANIVVIGYSTNATRLITLLYIYIYIIKLLLINNSINIIIFTIYSFNKGKIMRMIPILNNVLMFPYHMNILVIKLLIVKISNK